MCGFYSDCDVEQEERKLEFEIMLPVEKTIECIMLNAVHGES